VTVVSEAWLAFGKCEVPLGEGAGHNDAGVDTELGGLVGGDDGEGVERCFGGDVGTEKWRGRDDDGAADVEQRAGALPAQVRQRGAVDSVRADRVDVQQVGDVLIGEGFDVPDVEVAGVLHDDVEPALLIDHGLHGGVG